MKCYALSTKDQNLILTKPQFDKFLKSSQPGYQCLKCNSFEEAEIALHKLQSRKNHKSRNMESCSKEECVMFYDSEFNCPDEKGSIQEIISIGAIICDMSGNEKSRFYSTVKPIKTPRLTKRCKELTFLSQDEIDLSENLYWVCKRFCEWYEEYNVTSIYTLGKSDSTQLKKSMQIHKQHKYIQRIANELKDIRPILEKRIDKSLSVLSLSNLKAICGLDKRVRHNALLDAIDLKDVYFKLMSGEYDKELVQKINHDQIEKQRYKQARNVKNQKIFVTEEIMNAKDMLVTFLQEKDNLADIDKIVLKAMICLLYTSIALEVDGAIHMLKVEHDKEKTKKLLAEGYDYVFRLRSGQIPKLEDESVEIIVEKNGIADAVKILLSKLNELAEEEIFDVSKAEDKSVDDQYFYVDRDEIWSMKKDLCMKEMKRLHTAFLPGNYCSKDENFPIGKWLMNQRAAARRGELSKYRYEDFLSEGIDLKEYKNKKKCH